MSARRVHYSFWLLAIVQVAAALILARWMPLRPYAAATPLPDIRTFSPSLAGAFAYFTLFSSMFAGCLLAYKAIQQQAPHFTLPAILAVSFLVGLIFVQTFPINATDVYRYVIRGRISSVYGQSPYTTAPSDIPADDPFAAMAGEWKGAASPYGPLWEITATVATAVTRDNLLNGLYAFKALGLTLFLAASWLIWQISGHNLGKTVLWAWNPALWLMFVVDAHNDVFMLFWLLLGLWLWRRGHVASGFLVMVLGALTKPIGLLPLPFFWLTAWRHLPDNRLRFRFGAMTVGGTAVLAFLAFLPFGNPFALVQRLVQEASSGTSFSPITLIMLLNLKWQGPLTLTRLNRLAVAGFGLFALWLVWRTWHGRSPLAAAADIFIAYVWQALSFRIWYTTWPLAFLLLDEEGNTGNGRLTPRQQSGLWLLFMAQISVLIYGHLRIYALGGDYLWAHLIGVPMVFIFPWLLPVKRKD
ncbi:MAG: hypothetical protein Kow0080_35250 [Candidatus Promineifilaceae bacterium]